MEKSKIINAIKFYLLATELKDKIRSGWKRDVWNIQRERLESVAEHIYGTCILAIAIDSEFEMKIDLKKVILMLVIHELEEIKIGDLTPFDKITKEKKRKIGREAVCEILGDLTKGKEYIDLIDEFEEMQTTEAKFCKMIDKLEANLQAKIYCEENRADIDKINHKKLLEDERIQKMMKAGNKTVADFFIESDKPIYTKEFLQIADFVKEKELCDLDKNRFDRRKK